MTERLVKMFTRDFSLFMVQWWFESLLKDFKREFGAGYADTPMYSDGLSLTCFHTQTELDNVKSAIFEKKFKQQPNYYADSREKYLEDTAKSRRSLKEFKNQSLSLDAVNLLRERFFTIFPMLRLCNFFPHFWEKEARAIFAEKAGEIIAIAYKDRSETEGVMELIDSLLRRMARDKLAEIGKPVIFSKFLSQSELSTLAARKEINWDVIAARTGGYVQCRGKLYETRDWQTVFKQYGYLYEEEKPSGNLVKGAVAFQGGVVKGKVHMLFALEQIPTFKEGEVLVTPMTVPDFIPAMKKAAAIVTDEGGVTCHAAIVSRELKIPCVIGTKVATKLFKDGDVVEVDTVKGIVKKLS